MELLIDKFSTGGKKGMIEQDCLAVTLCTSAREMIGSVHDHGTRYPD
jgi:hypothetical protein